jgi:large subunit ribosomal protein L9
MKVILINEVTGLGTAGDVVDVKDGYARNFLLPRHLATPWTKGGQKQVDAITTARASRESASVTVPAKAGNAGRLFGAVSTADIADAVKAAGGPELDRRRIEVQGHIKSTGSYQALVRLHPDVQATVPFEVVAR